MLFEAAKVLTEVHTGLVDFRRAVSAKIDGPAGPELADEKREALRKAEDHLKKTLGLVTVACDRETFLAFLGFCSFVEGVELDLHTNPYTIRDSGKDDCRRIWGATCRRRGSHPFHDPL